MQQDHRTVLADSSIVGTVLMFGISLTGIGLGLMMIGWAAFPTLGGNIFQWLAGTMLLFGGGFMGWLLLNHPIRQRLRFDQAADTLEIELRYVGKTAKRSVNRGEVAALDWVVLPGGGEADDLKGARLRLVDGLELFLRANRSQTETFAAAIKLHLNHVEVTGIPVPPPIFRTERTLYPTSATR